MKNDYVIEVEHAVRSMLKITAESEDRAREIVNNPGLWPLPIYPPIGVYGSQKILTITKQ